MPFKPGKSGNPAGRRKRALTEILEAGHKGVVEWEGQYLERSEFLAHLLWEFATHGRVTLADGRVLTALDASDWFAAAKWLFEHIDGPPKDEAFSGALTISIERGEDEQRVEGGAEVAALASGTEGDQRAQGALSDSGVRTAVGEDDAGAG